MASGKYLLQGNHFFSNLTIKEESRVVQLLGKPRPRANPTCQSQNFYTFSASHVEPVRLVFLAPVSCWAPASGSLLARTPLRLPSLPKSHRVRCAEQHLLVQLDRACTSSPAPSFPSSVTKPPKGTVFPRTLLFCQGNETTNSNMSDKMRFFLKTSKVNH